MGKHKGVVQKMYNNSNTVNIFIPTWEFFNKKYKEETNEDSTKSDWISNCIPYAIYPLLAEHYINRDDLQDKENVVMRPVFLDEKFDKWLSRFNMKVTQDTMERYAMELSDDDCFDMLKKYSGMQSYSLNFLSYTVTFGSSPMNIFDHKLPEDIVEEFQKYLESIFGEGKVITGDRTYDINSAHQNISNLYDDLVFRLENPLSTFKPSESAIEGSNASFVDLFIPFLVKEELSTTDGLFNVGDGMFYNDKGSLIASKTPGILVLDRRNLKKQGLKHVKPFKKTKVYKKIMDAYSNDVIINDLFFVQDYELIEYYNDKIAVLEQTAERLGIKINKI